MTQSQYIINRKVNIVELSEKIGNISEACRNLGVSRQHFYDVKEAIEEDGLEGLLEKLRRSPRIANCLSPEIEKMVLDYSLEYPTRGQYRVANELKSKGTMVSDGGVRGIWSRHTLLRKPDRLKRHRTFPDKSVSPSGQRLHGTPQPDHPRGILCRGIQKDPVHSIAQMQTDLDTYMEEYNTRRTNRGKRCLGRTPKQTWDDGYNLL